MRIGITGATGFIGQQVVKTAVRRGHEVVAFSRDAKREIRDCVEVRAFDLKTPPNMEGCEAVIHLAAESVMGLWTKAKKQRIVQSRVEGTRRLAEAIRTMSQPPEVLVSASAIGFYGDAGEAELTEESPAGSGFLAETCSAWEMEAKAVENLCRVVTPRIGLVFGKGGGAMKVMEPLFRCCLGGAIGSGRQWMSWIHLEDLAKLLLFAVENMDVRGALNATSPYPVRNGEFTEVLAHSLRRPAIFRAPAFLLRAALRDFSHELLDSKRVIPARAIDEQFPFSFPDLESALKDLRASA